MMDTQRSKGRRRTAERSEDSPVRRRPVEVPGVPAPEVVGRVILEVREADGERWLGVGVWDLPIGA